MKIEQSFRKLVTASVMFCAVGIMSAHAQTVTHYVSLASSGSTGAAPEIDAVGGGVAGAALDADAATGRPAIGAGKDFKFDVYYGSTAAQNNDVIFNLHFDSSKIAMIDIEDILPATVTTPSAALFHFFVVDQTADAAGATLPTDRVWGGSWTSSGAWGQHGATEAAPVKMATLTIRYLDSAAGETHLYMSAGNGSSATTLEYTAVVFQGRPIPQVATLSVDTPRVDQTADAITVMLTCELVGDAPTTATNCLVPEPTATILGTGAAAVGGGTNYTISPTGVQTIAM
ncbi:MAG: hypothetical protein OD918_08090, partial [Gammaproteobacteria bacterium]